jgi:hypothetical protein
MHGPSSLVRMPALVKMREAVRCVGDDGIGPAIPRLRLGRSARKMKLVMSRRYFDVCGHLQRLGRATCPALALCLCLLSATTSRASDVAAEPEQDEDSDASAEEPEAEPPPLCSDTKMRLGGVVYVHDEADRSLAMLRLPQSPHTGLYHRGMYVAGYTIVAVEPRGVLLEREGTLCWLRLVPDPNAPDPPPRRGKKAKKKKRR